MIHFLDPFSKVNLLRRLFTNILLRSIFLNSFGLMLDYKYEYFNEYFKTELDGEFTRGMNYFLMNIMFA